MNHNTKQSGDPLKLELRDKLINKIYQAMKQRGAEIEVDLAGADEPETMKEQIKILKKLKKDGVVKKYKIKSQNIKLDDNLTKPSNLEKEMNPACEFEYEQTSEAYNAIDKNFEYWTLNIKKLDISKSKLNTLVNISAQEKATKGKGSAIESKPESKSKFTYNDQTGLGALRGKRFKIKDNTRERTLFDTTYANRGKKIQREDVIEKLGLDPSSANNKKFSLPGGGYKIIRSSATQTIITKKISDISHDIRRKTGLTDKEFVNNNTNITLNI